MTMTDLTKEEQEYVRLALCYLRVKCGGTKSLSKVLHADIHILRDVLNGDRAASASLTFRAARLAKVAIEDVLDGTYPPQGICPHCGHKIQVSNRLKVV